MAKKNYLTSEFIIELFKAAFEKDYIFEILIQYLKFSYLTHEHEKKFWKKAVQIFRLKNKVPTLGLIQVEFRKDEKLRDYIVEIKEANSRNFKSIIDSFQQFIKESKFVEIFEKAGEFYNRGEEDKAFSVFQAGAEEFSSFSIQDKVYKKVFDGFEERQADRLIKEQRIKLPFFIDELDQWTFGGAELGESVLVMSESGVGKSQYLIHRAVSTARTGYDVLLFQIEGTERQVMDRIDASWTGIMYHDMKKGDVDESKFKKLKTILKKMSGEIFVEAFEKFGGAYDTEIKQSIREAKKLHPNIKLVLIDYLELMSINDGNKYSPNDERFRQQKLARFVKEIAMEFDVLCETVTQASNLLKDKKDDPSFVMTREFLSEDKGKIRPFDYFFTLNQTTNEIKKQIIRIYADKMREYKSGRIAKIVTNFSRSRFYNRKATLNMLANIEHDEEDE